MQQEPTWPQRAACPACGAVLSLHERYAGGYCNDWRCRHRRSETRRKAEFAARLAHDRDTAAAELGDPSAAAAPVVRVGRHETHVVPLPDAWRQDLHDHLLGFRAEVEAAAARAPMSATNEANDVIELATRHSSPDDAGAPSDLSAGEPPMSPGMPMTGTTPESGVAPASGLRSATDASVAMPDAVGELGVDALLGRICAACAGYCCRQGHARHGFIDAELLLRAQRRHPGASFDDLVAVYLDALPALHLAQSCGFHGERGCTLPRERRSDICNGFECRGLEQSRRLAETQGVRRVYLVRHNGDDEPVGSFAGLD